MSWWWLSLPVLLLPIWWHRRLHEHGGARPFAGARFLPRAEPQRRRIWRWVEHALLLVRCLLLLALIAWLAGAAPGWRGDAVLVVPGTDAQWVAQRSKEAGLAGATRIALPDRDGLGWLVRHAGQWRAGARILLVGDVAMPAHPPAVRQTVLLATRPAPVTPQVRHIHIAGQEASWRRLFEAASDPVRRYVFDAVPGPATDLIVWNHSAAPPAGWHAPLWWRTQKAAIAGRVWDVDPAATIDPAQARDLLVRWQRLHEGPQAYTAPALTLAAGSTSAAADRNLLAWLLLVLFALERILAHARRR